MSKKLIVTIKEGKGIKSGKSLFGKADPYVLISIGDNKMEKTRVNPRGGTDPVFNQDLIFDITGDEAQLIITVYDKQTTGNDRFMAEYTAPMSKILSDGIKDYVVLTDKLHKEEGKLYLSTRFDKVKREITPPETSINIFSKDNEPEVNPWDRSNTKEQVYASWPDTLDHSHEEYHDNEYLVVVKKSNLICGMSRCRFCILMLVLSLAAAPIAIGVGYFFGVKNVQYAPSWIDSWPEFQLKIFSSQPRGFVVPSSQRRMLRLIDEISDSRKLDSFSVPRLCTSNPADPFQDEDCALQYFKDRIYGNPDKPGILTKGLSILDKHIKNIKDKVKSMEYEPECFGTSADNIKYEPVLPNKISYTYNFPMYFKCFDKTDEGTIYFGEQDSIYYIADFVDDEVNSNGLFLILDSKNDKYDLWIVISAPNTANWALHTMGSLSTKKMYMSTAGTLDGSRAIGGGCGVIMVSDASSLLYATGIFEDALTRNNQNGNYFCSDYHYQGSCPYALWSPSGVGVLCGDSNYLSSNLVYQTGICAYLQAEVGNLDPTIFPYLEYLDMSPLGQKCSDLLTKYKDTTLSNVIDMSVKSKEKREIKQKNK